MKYIRKFYIKYVVFIFISLLFKHYSTFSATSTNKNEMKVKRLLIKSLQKELDSLIGKLSNQKPINETYNKNFVTSKKYNPEQTISLSNLKDEKKIIYDDIVSSFELINNDFLKFEKMLNETNIEDRKQNELEKQLLKNLKEVPNARQSYSYYEFVEYKNIIINNIKNIVKFIKEVKKSKYPDSNKIQKAHSKLKDLQLINLQYNDFIRKKSINEIKQLKDSKFEILSVNETIKKLFILLDKVLMSQKKLKSRKISSETLSKITTFKKLNEKLKLNEDITNFLKQNSFKNIIRNYTDKNLIFNIKPNDYINLEKAIANFKKENNRILKEKQIIIHKLKNITEINLDEMSNLINKRKIQNQNRMNYLKKVYKIANHSKILRYNIQNMKQSTTGLIDENEKLLDTTKNCIKIKNLKKLIQEKKNEFDHRYKVYEIAKNNKNLKDNIEIMKKNSIKQNIQEELLYNLFRKFKNLKKLEKKIIQKKNMIDHTFKLYKISKLTKNLKDSVTNTKIKTLKRMNRDIHLLNATKTFNNLKNIDKKIQEKKIGIDRTKKVFDIANKTKNISNKLHDAKKKLEKKITKNRQNKKIFDIAEKIDVVNTKLNYIKNNVSRDLNKINAKYKNSKISINKKEKNYSSSNGKK